jgi:hypothetical protein
MKDVPKGVEVTCFSSVRVYQHGMRHEEQLRKVGTNKWCRREVSKPAVMCVHEAMDCPHDLMIVATIIEGSTFHTLGWNRYLPWLPWLLPFNPVHKEIPTNGVAMKCRGRPSCMCCA